MKHSPDTRSFGNFDVHMNEFHPNRMGAKNAPRLDPGMYKIKVNPMEGRFWFEKFESKHDSIIDLPSPEYNQVVSEMEFFLRPETRKKFAETGYLYKRSALLHGLPGTGKTCIVNRVCKRVVDSGGVVLFVEDPRILRNAYEALDAIQPEVLTMVILEEIDYMIDRGWEQHLLSVLDGEVQKQNVMYLATTNFIGKIPPRIRRPGRFSSVIQVNYPNADARKVYFELKLGRGFPKMTEWVEKTNNLSVDDLKECVQAVYILEQNLDAVVKRLHDTKDIPIAVQEEGDDYASPHAVRLFEE
jgi:Cdc6-like AAA superfamily ATPase